LPGEGSALAKPVYIVINPRSGYGGLGRLLAELQAQLRREGIASVRHVTTAPRDATRYVRGVASDARAIIVWGGDGTVNEVAEGLAGTEVPLLPCRAGTENLLAKDLGIPVQPAAIARIVRDGLTEPCDVATVNGRTFLMTLGVGFDAEVVRRVTAARTGRLSHWSYFWPIWRTFWEFKFPLLRVIADGREVFHDHGMVFVGNIARYCAGLRVCEQARRDDGLLDVAAMSCRGRARMVRHSLAAMRRRQAGRKGVVYERARVLRVESDRSTVCQVDGDAGPQTPLDIRMTPLGVRLLVPGQPTTGAQRTQTEERRGQ
jgi:YegS/Rv2252/BmrU family lipid kinase